MYLPYSEAFVDFTSRTFTIVVATTYSFNHITIEPRISSVNYFSRTDFNRIGNFDCSWPGTHQ